MQRAFASQADPLSVTIAPATEGSPDHRLSFLYRTHWACLAVQRRHTLVGEFTWDALNCDPRLTPTAVRRMVRISRHKCHGAGQGVLGRRAWAGRRCHARATTAVTPGLISPPHAESASYGERSPTLGPCSLGARPTNKVQEWETVRRM